MKGGNSGDDSKLIEDCINRDLPAWSDFIKKYSGLILIAVQNRLKLHGISVPAQETEDIRQEVLSSLWKDGKLKAVRDRSDVSCWLAVVSGNAAVEYARRKRLYGPGRFISIFDKIDDKEFADIVPSAELSPADELARDEVSRKVEDAVESLPDKEKLAVKLKIFYGKKYREIADIINIPEGTVASHINRAKEKLKKKLRELK